MQFHQHSLSLDDPKPRFLMNESEILKTAGQLVREVGHFLRTEQARVKASDVEEKEQNSLVSYVDRAAEERLVEGLRQLVPGAAFLTEEGTVAQEEAEYQWIIDPLDGTTNYLYGLPLYAVSVALRRGDELRLGLVYEVGQDELFTAKRGGGAYCNGLPIRVSGAEQLEQALFATGFPYRDYGRLEAFNRLLTHFYRRSRGLRRFGSAATDLAYVACGRFSGFFEYGLSPWDVAAGVLLVVEAGGQVSDFQGGADYLFNGEMVAASKALFTDFLAVVNQEMGTP